MVPLHSCPLPARPQFIKQEAANTAKVVKKNEYSTLLAGMETGIATMGGSVVLPQETKNRISM